MKPKRSNSKKIKEALIEKLVPGTRKVVINTCYGVFSLSPEACTMLYNLGYRDKEFAVPIDTYFGTSKSVRNKYDKKKGIKAWQKYKADPSKDRGIFFTILSDDEKYVLCERDVPRDNEKLIQVIETLGAQASSGPCADLKIVEIPSSIDWSISEYDGNETIEENHQRWS